MVTYLGVVKEGRIELEERLPVSDGQAVRVSVELVPSEPPLDSPAGILQALHEPPHLEEEDVDALERAIADGALPVMNEGVFDSD